MQEKLFLRVTFNPALALSRTTQCCVFAPDWLRAETLSWQGVYFPLVHIVAS